MAHGTGYLETPGLLDLKSTPINHYKQNPTVLVRQAQCDSVVDRHLEPGKASGAFEVLKC